MNDPKLISNLCSNDVNQVLVFVHLLYVRTIPLFIIEPSVHFFQA